MTKIFEFIKKNWALLILIVIAVKYFFGGISANVPMLTRSAPSFESLSSTSVGSAGVAKMMDSYLPSPQYAPTDVSNRLVIRDTTLSLHVENVSKVITQAENLATKLGGFMIDSSLSTPEGASNGSITLRVPADHLSEALDGFRKMAVKVVSENVYGQDVTDQFVDTEARLKVLTDTKVKFEDILKSAENVNELLSVQRELVNLQSQIDSLKGQQQYLEKSAKLAKISLILSTDDLSLPYTPDQAWRPAVIFKRAVRSLVSSVRQIGTALIWVLVYSPVALLVIALIWFLKKRGLLK